MYETHFGFREKPFSLLPDPGFLYLGRVPPSEESAVAIRPIVSWPDPRLKAKAQGVPAYVILSDATLLAIAQARPQSLTALRGISGIGDVKLERFGESLLSLTRQDD